MTVAEVSTERSLVLRILAGDRAAFDELFDRSFEPMLALAGRALPPASARAVTAASLYEFFTSLGEPSSRRSLAERLLAIGRRRVSALRQGLGAGVGDGDAASRMR